MVSEDWHITNLDRYCQLPQKGFTKFNYHQEYNSARFTTSSPTLSAIHVSDV